MNKILAVNGRWYDVLVPRDGGLKREVSILDGANAQRLLSGGITLDTIGTYYNYTYTVVRNGDKLAEYDALHKALRDPKDRRKQITVPFDQGYITFEAYVSGVSDTLVRMKDGKNYWDGMSIKFVATDPNEVA